MGISASLKSAVIGLLLGLACLGGLAEAANVFRDPLYGYQKKTDVTYGWAPTQSAMVALKLDIYLPADRAVPRLKPGMVLMHGGGWSQGDKSSGFGIASEFARRGYVAVSINYRLRGDNPIISDSGLCGLVGKLGDNELVHGVTAAVEDLLTAVRWMRDNAGVYGIDPSRIAVGGDSAGAITSIVAVHCCNDLAVRDVPEIAAVMNLWGGWPYYWGASFDMKAYLDIGEPPCVSVHGTADRSCPLEQSTVYHQRLSLLRIENLLMLNEDAGHGWGENPIFTTIYDGRTEFQNIVDFFYDVMELKKLDPKRLDLDGNRVINFRDFAILARKWQGARPGPCDDCEPAADEQVDIEDLNMLAINWLVET